MRQRISHAGWAMLLVFGLFSVPTVVAGPLTWATWRGDLDEVRRLIEEGADLNARARSGRTPLITAIDKDHTAIAELLIHKGADVNAKDKKGITPLQWAIWKDGTAAVAELLIKKGADVNAKDRCGRTPLHWVTSPAMAELMVSRGADVNVMTKDGRTPLHQAALREYFETVEFLINKGANINARDKWGFKPSDRVWRCGKCCAVDRSVSTDRVDFIPCSFLSPECWRR